MGILDRLKSGKGKGLDHGAGSSKKKKKKQGDDFQPPPGPPPDHARLGRTSLYPQQTKASREALEDDHLPGPSTTYHNWQAVPDTSLLPPPPPLDNDISSSSNADAYLADKAIEWERMYHPFAPESPPVNLINDVKNGNLFLRAPEHRKRGEVLSRNGPLSCVRTVQDSKDHCYLSSLPLYFERIDSPFRTETAKAVYYEIKINSLGKFADGSESSVAIGYCVGPYPTWRMPGWQRGSLAVHGDDGARFVSNDAGGADFTTPFIAGETVGLGVRFSIPQWNPQRIIDASGQSLTGEVFFTRNGRVCGGWNIQDGLDQEFAYRSQYLDGKWDLYAAIGTYGEVEILVNFGGQKFEYNPASFTGL